MRPDVDLLQERPRERIDRVGQNCHTTQPGQRVPLFDALSSPSAAILEKPAIFPPGRARLYMSPAPIGSATAAITTIGMVVVAFFAATVHGVKVPPRSARRPAGEPEPAANSGSRSAFPSAERELEGKILSLGITELAQSFPKRPAKRLCIRARQHQGADPRDSPLPPRRERPCGGAADQGDELAAPHSITSSALASRVGGTSTPSAFAVLRLIGKLVFGRRLHGKVGRLLALEDTIDVAGRASVRVDRIGPVGHQAAVGDEQAIGINRRQVVPRRQRDDQLSMSERQPARHHEQAAIGGRARRP